jgi:hypothetical protein
VSGGIRGCCDTGDKRYYQDASGRIFACCPECAPNRPEWAERVRAATPLRSTRVVTTIIDTDATGARAVRR